LRNEKKTLGPRTWGGGGGKLMKVCV
jgi:hypothetical protein